MPHCLITGATGFIGGQIARAAVRRGWRVRGLRRRDGVTGDIGDVAVEWVQGDLNDHASLAHASHGCDVVFHCAGAYPHAPRTMAQDVENAVSQMRNVLQAVREVGTARLVYTSSYTTIGRPAEPGRLADERDFYVPGTSGDPYYEAKWAMEVEALHAAQTGLPVVVLCPVAVFGPGDVHMAVSGPLLMAARGRLPVYPDATLGVVDVRDVAEAHIAAAERGQTGERTILSAHNVTLYEALAAMARVTGVPPPRIKLGPRLLRIAAALGELAPGGQASFLKTIPLWQPVNNAKAVRELGLTTRPLLETMTDTAAWFHARGTL